MSLITGPWRLLSCFLLTTALAAAEVLAVAWQVPVGEALELVRRPGWTPLLGRVVAPGTAVCLVNERLAVVAVPGAPAVRLFARLGEGWIPAGALSGLGLAEAGAATIASCTPYETYADQAVLEVAWRSGAGDTVLRLRLGAKDAFVTCAAVAGAGRVRLEAQSRRAVVVDCLGGDLVVDAARIAAGRARLPSEHQVMQLVPGGEAILLAAWPDPRQTVEARFAGAGDARTLAIELELLPERCGDVRLSVLTGPGIWFTHGLRDLAEGEGTACGWHPPFAAEWRVDLPTLPDGFVDSWRPASQGADGAWLQHWNRGAGPRVSYKGTRTMWQSVRGTVPLLAFLAGGDTGALHLVRHVFHGVLAPVRHPQGGDLAYDPEGSAVVYPFERTRDTPKASDTVIDLLRLSFERTLANAVPARMRAQRSAGDIYPATCGVTMDAEKIFNDGEEAGKRRDLLREIQRMDCFVVGIRTRLDEYLAWSARCRAGFTARRAEAPALVDRFLATLGRIEAIHAERLPKMRSLAEYLALSARLAALAEAPPGVDREAVANDLGRQIRTVGGTQDACLGGLRLVVRELRQDAGHQLLRSTTDAEAALCVAVRAACAEMLATYIAMEGNPEWAP